MVHSNVVYTGSNNLSFCAALWLLSCEYGALRCVEANLMEDVQQGKTALPASHRTVAGIRALQVEVESMDRNILRPIREYSSSLERNKIKNK